MVDDVATKEGAAAACAVTQRGVPMVAVAHGRNLIDLLHSSELHGLLGASGCASQRQLPAVLRCLVYVGFGSRCQSHNVAAIVDSAASWRSGVRMWIP